MKKTKNTQTTKKALENKKVKSIYQVQNENRKAITEKAKTYKKDLKQVIREYFSKNYLTVISAKEWYSCDNGSINYRYFIKSDKKLPKDFINSKGENDIKTMILLNDKTKHIKCCIGLEPLKDFEQF